MKLHRSVAMAALALCVVVDSQAAEIIVVAPGSIKAAVEQMIPAFEKQTGHTVKASFGPGSAATAQVLRGDVIDVPILQPPFPDVLASGHVVAGSETPLARVAVGIAVRQGAPHPDIATVEAVKKLLLSARAVAYPDPARGAVAGISFAATLVQLGIAEQLKPKVILSQGGAAAMGALARGEVDIGVTFISEIITEPGVEVVGALPEGLSKATGLSAFVGAHSRDPAAAKALVDYLSSTEAARVYRDRGMIPAR